jgi:hypothetical protein
MFTLMNASLTTTGQELEMNKLAIITMSVAVLASTSVFSNAFAQEKTRAEVRQELIQAENNGSRFVTDASYPDVSPIYARQVAQLKAADTSGVGSAMSGTSISGAPAKMNRKGADETCVGPVDFCTPFFGS